MSQFINPIDGMQYNPNETTLKFHSLNVKSMVLPDFSQFTRLSRLIIINQVPSAFAKQLTGLTCLQELWLRCDEVPQDLFKLTHLTRLSLAGLENKKLTQEVMGKETKTITTEVKANLAGITALTQLTQLDLPYGTFFDTDFSPLTSLTRLSVINLSGSTIKNTTLTLSKSLKSLDLTFCFIDKSTLDKSFPGIAMKKEVKSVWSQKFSKTLYPFKANEVAVTTWFSEVV